MRTLLFVDYWSLHEPLTQATVLPTLRMVMAEGLADRLVLVTVERGMRAVDQAGQLAEGIAHVPLVATTGLPRSLARGWDLLRMVGRIARIAKAEQAGFIMARGVVAGGFSHFASSRAGLSYAVDYFEPHNRYMTDVGEWSIGGPLDRGLGWLIAQQIRTAKCCITVSNNYRLQLIAGGADPGRLRTAPCPVDQVRMRFDQGARDGLRQQLGWGDACIGVYAGKFGGLYHREHAFRAFTMAQHVIGERFGLLILSPDDKEAILQGLRASGYTGDRVVVKYAQHAEVGAYLSAADLAFAPYRGTPSSACISPMKVGEYWANGLPVLLTRGVGDDSGIIMNEPLGGALFDPEGGDLEPALLRVMEIIAGPGQRAATAALADRYRSMDITRDVYREVLGNAFHTA